MDKVFYFYYLYLQIVILCIKQVKKQENSGNDKYYSVFKQKSVLKDKNDIIGFENWPLAIQMMYVNPDPDMFED